MVCLKEIRHIIADELGMHARPAAQLAKRCSVFKCSIKIGNKDNMVDAKRIMGIMSLALKCKEELIMTFDGPDANEAATEMAAFLKENL